jgi:omega-amidase
MISFASMSATPIPPRRVHTAAALPITADAPDASRLVAALGEYDTGWHDAAGSLAGAERLAAECRRAGAQLLVLPEMCTTGFTMEAATQAELPDGPSTRALADVARRYGLWLIAGVALRRGARFVNTALAFSPAGDVVATYEKQRLFGYAGETDVYAGGDGPCVVQIAGLSVALFVCFDLRFPELFREVAAEVDACVVIANWPAARRAHWDTLVRARAIENQCYVVAVNRTGEAGGLRYDGGSRIYDPWGEAVDGLGDGGGVRVGELSRDTVTTVRRSFPLFADRRPQIATVSRSV